MQTHDKCALAVGLFLISTVMAAAGCGTPKATTNPDGEQTETPVDRASPDGAAPDGAAPDGAASDGAAPDGAAPDGAAPDGAAPDGAAPDGAAPDGAAPDGAAPDGAAPDGAAPDGAASDAPSPDAATATTTAVVTFRFRNAKTVPVFLRRECQFLIAVTSAADGKTYSNASFCACDCASSTCLGGLACGACAPPSGEDLPPGAVEELVWFARSSALQVKTVQQTFQCVAHTPIPTGTYTVGMAVFDTQQDAATKMNAHLVERTFTLGTADAVVEVPIQ